MRVLALAGLLCVGLAPAAFAADGEISVERGMHIAIIGGCNDCHTDGYNESSGKIDPAVALKGTNVGFMGPWGTTYPKNLRLTAVEKATNEDEFVQFLKSFETKPPMPWYNVHALTENDMRSLYQYIKSLGDPGVQSPDDLDPGVVPKTPYIVFAPPTMPK